MDEQSFDQLLKSALSRTPDQLADARAPEPHPEPDVLQRHHAQELDATQSQQVQEHIEACAFCARRFLDFDVPPPVDPRDENFDLHAGWERLRHLAGADRPAPPSVAAPFPAGTDTTSMRRRWLPLAAAITAFAAGLGVGRYRSGVSTWGPATERTTIELTEETSVRRDGSQRLEREAPSRPAGSVLLLLLSVPEPPASGVERYEARLYRGDAPDATAVLTWPHIAVASDGLITLDVAAGAVTPGSYTVRLYRPDRTGAVASYRWRAGAP